jgi:hypothetical protein
MDGLRADGQGAHIQHAIERRNDVGNRAPDGEGKIEPQELGHKAQPYQNSKHSTQDHNSRGSQGLEEAHHAQ